VAVEACEDSGQRARGWAARKGTVRRVRAVCGILWHWAAQGGGCLACEVISGYSRRLWVVCGLSRGVGGLPQGVGGHRRM